MSHLGRLLKCLSQVEPEPVKSRVDSAAPDAELASLEIFVGGNRGLRLNCSLERILNILGMSSENLHFDLESHSSADNDDDIPGDYSTDPHDAQEEELFFDRDLILLRFLQFMTLEQHHEEELERRGLNGEQIVLNGYRSLTPETLSVALERLRQRHSENEILSIKGFATHNGKLTIAGPNHGLVIPVVGLYNGGHGHVGLKLRQDVKHQTENTPEVFLVGDDGGSCHVPWSVPRHPALIRLTTGELKADVASELTSEPTIGIPSMRNWRMALPALQQLNPRIVRLAFDAGCESDSLNAQCVVACARMLQQHGYEVEIERWTIDDGKGIDDLLMNHKVAEVLRGDVVETVLSEQELLLEPCWKS